MKRIVILSVLIVILLMINTFAISSKSYNIVNPYEAITYEIMVNNLQELEKQYPELIEVETIGKSVDKRDILLAKLGKGDTLIHINGSFHARERITTNMILKNIEDLSIAYEKESKIDGYNVKELLNQVTIYFVPMVNPDGVDYTIDGVDSIRNPEVAENLKEIKEHPASEWFVPNLRWKSNIRGVDLNRQWDFGWNEPSKFDIDGPADAHFKGFSPHSEPEVKALEKLSIENPFMNFTAYHTQGLEIYWYKYQEGEDLEEVKDLTSKIANLTFFRPVPVINHIPEGFRSYSGYADWTAVELKKPSFTMEFAYRAYTEEDFDRIYLPARALPLLLAQEAIEVKAEYSLEVMVDGKTYQYFKRQEDAMAFINKHLSKDRDITILNGENIVFQEKGRPFLEEATIKVHHKKNGDMVEYNGSPTILRYKGDQYLMATDILKAFNYDTNYYDEIKVIVGQRDADLLLLSLHEGLAYFNHQLIGNEASVMEFQEKGYISVELVEEIFHVTVDIDNK
ncbi:M14 family metallopeptidase [Alkaliphilus serpentinus]|uniref:Peptidase M14 domain-containing protein n=1 Tax=Alkaliphilus serpentinus TaxID=1482731 RepID=A0A833M8J6_9FIRM|nr:M14 family metallocarboxypeptidase [Alkaliphilus serpentinus]KAB3531132.1 hypothetical protein F8153_05730 [Alkaliphilus serpentinus]